MSLDHFIPQNIKEAKAYVPGKTIAEVREAYQPKHISKLASNENRFGRSTAVDAAVQAALASIQDYPDPLARELKSAISTFYSIDAARVMVGAGSESLLAGLFRTFFDGSEQLVSGDATFVGAFIQAKIRGVQVKRIPLTSDYRFDVQAITDAIEPSTKMIYIANPNNPTGTYITKNEFERLMAHVPENVLVVMDEAYFEFAQHVSDYPDVLSYGHDNVIVLRTFSKGYGLAGFRIGYAIAHPELIGYMMKTRMTFEPDAVAQAAALAAIQDQKFLATTTALIEEGKQDLAAFFDEHGVKYAKSAANFVMIDLGNAEKAAKLTQHCLEEGVILRHIAGFGLPNCVRITIGQSKEMDHFKAAFLAAIA